MSRVVDEKLFTIVCTRVRVRNIEVGRLRIGWYRLGTYFVDSRCYKVTRKAQKSPRSHPLALAYLEQLEAESVFAHHHSGYSSHIHLRWYEWSKLALSILVVWLDLIPRAVWRCKSSVDGCDPYGCNPYTSLNPWKHKHPSDNHGLSLSIETSFDCSWSIRTWSRTYALPYTFVRYHDSFCTTWFRQYRSAKCLVNWMFLHHRDNMRYAVVYHQLDWMPWTSIHHSKHHCRMSPCSHRDDRMRNWMMMTLTILPMHQLDTIHWKTLVMTTTSPVIQRHLSVTNRYSSTMTKELLTMKRDSSMMMVGYYLSMMITTRTRASMRFRFVWQCLSSSCAAFSLLYELMEPTVVDVGLPRQHGSLLPLENLSNGKLRGEQCKTGTRKMTCFFRKLIEQQREENE